MTEDTKMEKVEIGKVYVITGIENGKRVYVGIDHHSGGYEYWASDFRQAKQYDKAPTTWSSYLSSASDIKVLAVEIVGTVVTKESIEADIRAEAQKKIDEIMSQMEMDIQKVRTCK